jgi:asparagine synthase (glutamine-hydrolysing)
MCGIAGYIGKFLPRFSHLKKTSTVLQHRGPDGEGFYTHCHQKKSVALVHRRLAIIDPDSRSDQPFHYNGNVLIYNGEIYNYLEVRKELESLGHVFKTNGDTEVLSHALFQWGEDSLNKLEGMWAFAWYDERKGRLILSRDRFGEKPLYLWHKNNGLYFASEVKALAALVGEWPNVNENHLLRGLVNGYKALYKKKETFFNEVIELPSGTYLKIDSESISSPCRYWKPQTVEDESLSYADVVAMTKDAIINAVKIRMRSDVPLAFCMSGGVDSNSLISVASKILGCDVHGFTIMNTDSRYEEKKLVDQSVKELGIRHTPIKLEQSNFLENLRSLVHAHDAPVYTISYYVHSKLMQSMAEKGYKVAISGTGADELFTGYYDHHNLYLYEIFQNKNLYKNALNAWQKYQFDIVRNPYLKDPELYMKDPGFRDHLFLQNDLFATYLKKDWMESYTENNYVSSLLRNRMLNELFEETVPVILHEDDLNSMSVSIENRSPFLDRRLFDLAYSIPSRYLIQDARAKAVLRDAMRGIVPDSILDERRKVGFNAPIKDLLDIYDLKTREYLLDDGPVFNLVNKDKIELLLQHEELPNSESKFLFNFINMKIFMDNQIEVNRL